MRRGNLVSAIRVMLRYAMLCYAMLCCAALQCVEIPIKIDLCLLAADK